MILILLICALAYASVRVWQAAGPAVFEPHEIPVVYHMMAGYLLYEWIELFVAISSSLN